MKRFFKNKREIIFFGVSIILFIVVAFYIFQSVRFLASGITKAVSSEILRAGEKPVSFNLEKFEALNLKISQ